MYPTQDPTQAGPPSKSRRFLRIPHTTYLIYGVSQKWHPMSGRSPSSNMPLKYPTQDPTQAGPPNKSRRFLRIPSYIGSVKRTKFSKSLDAFGGDLI